MGSCFSSSRKKKVLTPGYTGTQATEEPQKLHAYGADAYELVGQLGSGRNGAMKLMRNKKTREMVAVKHVEREAGAGLSKNTEREIINHRKLVHESIIKFHEVYVTDDHLAIVMEYASGGTLAQRIKEAGPMAEETAKQLFVQLLAGMGYCHSLGDLRMENLLLSGSHFQPQLKITGFGYSKSAVLDSQPKRPSEGSVGDKLNIHDVPTTSSRTVQTNVGVPSYCPPELLLNTRDAGAVYDGSSNDIWSAGVILYFMLCAVLPFEDPANPGALSRKMMQKIVNVEYSYPPNIQLSPEVKELLSRIFTKDPTTRIKVPEMTHHPWLLGSKLPDKEEEAAAAQSSQTEVEIHQIVEKARRRRQQQQDRRRSAGGGAPATNGGLSRAASGRTFRQSSGVLPYGVGATQVPGPNSFQDEEEGGIAEVQGHRRR